MKEISISELCSLKKQAPGTQFVDVRSPSEYASGHIPSAVSVPLEEIEARQGDLNAEQPVVLICKSGTRACIAEGYLRESGRNISVLRGGTDGWVRAGLPLVVNAKTRLSLERQVRFAAGILLLSAVVLSVTIYAPMIYLAGLVGAGLTFAGATDYCPMGILLGKMRWNRARKRDLRRAGASAGI